MAFKDIFVTGSDGKRILNADGDDIIKPEYPKKYLCSVTSSATNEVIHLYSVDVSKDWMPDFNWMKSEPNDESR